MQWLREAKKPKYTQVKTFEEVKTLASRDGGADFIISLNFGLRTSYHLAWDGEKMYVLSMVDDSERELTPEEFMDPGETNFKEAMSKGALYHEQF